MRTIWKFELTQPQISMPVGAEVCTFEFQGDVPCIWAIVESGAPKETRRFVIIGTGHGLPPVEECAYVGTQQQGQFVWHLFELL